MKQHVGKEQINRLRDSLMRQLLVSRLQSRAGPETLLEIGQGELAAELLRQMPHLSVKAFDVKIPLSTSPGSNPEIFPFPPASFDGIFAEELSSDHDTFYAILNGIHRLLRPTGTLYLWDAKGHLHEWSNEELTVLIAQPASTGAISLPPADRESLDQRLKKGEMEPSFQLGTFTYKVASTPIEKMSVHRLRHKVFVEEMKALTPNTEMPGQEVDQFDGVSLLLGVFSAEGEAVATMRLILASEMGFTIHKYPGTLTEELPFSPKISEISRFATRRDFRRRLEDRFFSPIPADRGASKKDEVPPETQRIMILLGLFRLLYNVSLNLGITHWYCHMEKRLAYSLKRLGIFFEPIGPEVLHPDCRPRRTYAGAMAQMEKRLLDKDKGIASVILGPGAQP